LGPHLSRKLSLSLVETRRTPAFIGEVAYMYRAILLDSLKFDSVAGIHFDPGTHRRGQRDAFDVLTLGT